MSETNESLERYRKTYALVSYEADNRIAVDNLSELSVDAYNAGLITFEKFEYLLRLCGLVPGDLGIQKANESAFPSDDELAAIMEEDA